MDADDFSDGVVLSSSMVDVGSLHHSAELDVGGLVNAAVEASGRGRIAGFSIGFTEEVLTLDARNVASVSCKQFMST